MKKPSAGEGYKTVNILLSRQPYARNSIGCHSGSAEPESFYVHVSDAIDMVNISHNPMAKQFGFPKALYGRRWTVLLWTFLCPYCFKTIPMAEALKLKEENGWPTEFVHQVP